ncbi:hypothetical protein [Pseudooceanicola spongiae]|uniref:Uncharacterized protein n=1 Tax=Pseudooceanicola spongiae TaxID=2613965 RepID=A0A7L9WTX2_9RHOB|nr:hypothetical protein [Pseudooceanicola spongiae]QOL82530.1 hypothetical protein F3W81_17925 [Pseudooceanicola spongiae]
MNALDVISEQNARAYAANRATAAEERILVIDADTPAPSGDGDRSVSDLTDAEVASLTPELVGYLNLFGPAAIDLIDKLRVAENRQFLQEVGLQKMRFYKLGNGRQMVAFKGSNRLRTLITGTTYGLKGLTSKNISLLDVGVTPAMGNLKAGIKTVGSKAGVLSLIFVTSVDIGSYYAQPAHERELSDLMVDLGFDLTETAIGIVAGAVAAGLTMGAVVAAPVAVVVAFGLIVGIVVSIGISTVENYTGVRQSMKDALRNTEASSDSLYQQMMVAT